MSLLKEATAPHHARIEAALDVMQPSVSLVSYRQLLERMYGFYAPWEAQTAALIREPSLSFYADRWKLPLLHEDLCNLGHTNQSLFNLPSASPIPLTNIAQAFGSMYVIEGSTLGGKFIAKHMREHLGLTAEKGCAFFSAYGKEAARYWKEFGQRAQRAISPSEMDTAITSACATFTSMQDWLCEKAQLAA